MERRLAAILAADVVGFSRLVGADEEGTLRTLSAYREVIDSLAAMLVPLLPRFEGEGKSYLTIAVGCTGGRHRSVYVAERIAELLGAEGRPCQPRHRDLARDPG